MKKRILSAVLAGLVSTSAIGALSGCGIGGGVEVDASKTQLYISNYNGGQGTLWLDRENSTDDLIGRFEEQYKNVSFEEGKTGVQCIVTPTKTKGNNLISQMSGLDEEIFFSEDVPYGTAAEAGKFLDISDVVTEIANGAKVSVRKDRMDSLKVGAKYYALPHYEIYDGISYDVDLFEDELLYFADDRDNDNKGFLVSKNDVRSKGPDGQYDTWDDGLPATVDEFFELCDYMVTKSIIPMVWSGQYPFYFANAMNPFVANYLSKDELMANYTFDSNGVETEYVTGFDAADRPKIEKGVVTPRTGWMVYAQAAYYYALDFLKRIYQNPDYYYSMSTASTSFGNEAAQDVFVKSKLKGGDSKPIAMIVDGNWWYNEAQTSIKESYSYGPKAQNRRFGYFPIPTAQTKADGEKGKEMKLLNTYNSYVFIKSNINSSKINAAKEFLRFCYTEENCQQFTIDTGLHKAVEYNMTSAQLAALPYETRQIMEYKMAHGSYDARSNSPIFVQREGENRTRSIANKVEYDYCTDAYKNNVSAKDYFKGMWIEADSWESMYSRYFD